MRGWSRCTSKGSRWNKSRGSGSGRATPCRLERILKCKARGKREGPDPWSRPDRVERTASLSGCRHPRFQRPGGINGINIAAQRPDLLDRSLLIGREQIPENKRRTMTEVRAEFSREHPAILGGFIDAVAKALENLKHEFIDHSISKEVVEPLVGYVNMQKSLIENLIYRRKENLVNKLAKIL